MCNCASEIVDFLFIFNSLYPFIIISVCTDGGAEEIRAKPVLIDILGENFGAAGALRKCLVLFFGPMIRLGRRHDLPIYQNSNLLDPGFQPEASLFTGTLYCSEGGKLRPIRVTIYPDDGAVTLVV